MSVYGTKVIRGGAGNEMDQPLRLLKALLASFGAPFHLVAPMILC